MSLHWCLLLPSINKCSCQILSNHEQKYNRYRKSNTENSNQHKEKYEVQNDYDSGDSEYLFYHEGGYQSPTRETSLSSSDHSRSSTTTDNDNESIGSRHHDSMSNYSAKSSKKYSMSSKGNNKEHSESSKGSSRETYTPSHRPTTIFYPTSCSGKKCGSSKGSSKAAYSSSSKKQSKKGEYPSHEPTSKPIVQTANPTPIYPTPFITSLPTITPKPTLKPIEPTSPTPSTPTPTGCNDKGCPRPPRLDIPTSIPSTILRPPVISQEPSNFPSICIGPNCPPNSYSNIS